MALFVTWAAGLHRELFHCRRRRSSPWFLGKGIEVVKMWSLGGRRKDGGLRET
jgi:hypothetical protein